MNEKKKLGAFYPNVIDELITPATKERIEFLSSSFLAYFLWRFLNT